MNPLGRFLRAGVPIAVILLACVLPMPSRAEIGAAGGIVPSGPTPPPVYFAASTEDPDPVPWGRFSPVGSGRIVLNPLGDANGDGRPAIAVNLVSGLPLVAWARHSATGFDVVLSRFTNGEWTEPEVLAGAPVDELDPSLAIAPDGTVHLFWWENGSTPRVMHRQAGADLSSWSEPEQVSQSTQIACRPSGAVQDGFLHVAYEVHDYGFGGSPRQVVLAQQTSNGFTPEIVAITNNSDPVWPEVHVFNGRLWLDWIDAAGEVAWVRLDTQSHWEPARYEAFANREQRDFFVRGTIRRKAALEP